MQDRAPRRADAMRRAVRGVVVAVALACVAAPAGAELRYTTHMEVRPLPGASNHPLAALAGPLALSQLPSGDTTVIAGPSGARVELGAGFAFVPTGAILLVKDGAIDVLNPGERTFFRLPVPPAGLLGMAKTTLKRTGEFATVAGLRA